MNTNSFYSIIKNLLFARNPVKSRHVFFHLTNVCDLALLPGVVGAPGRHEVAGGDGHELLHRVEHVRLLGVAPGDLLIGSKRNAFLGETKCC